MIYYLPSLTVLLAFACLVTYEYIRDLRRRLETSKADADTGWHMYNLSQKELPSVKGAGFDPYLPDSQRGQKDASTAPFVPTGIGPTAINDRELRRDLQEKKRHEPVDVAFDTARHPTPETIRAAAREALNNNGEQK
jgi:hypothetical protein